MSKRSLVSALLGLALVGAALVQPAQARPPKHCAPDDPLCYNVVTPSEQAKPSICPPEICPQY